MRCVDVCVCMRVRGLAQGRGRARHRSARDRESQWAIKPAASHMNRKAFEEMDCDALTCRFYSDFTVILH